MVNYPDKYSCSWYHNCQEAGNIIELQCADQTVFDLDTRMCITPGTDFSCFPRCPGITFPDTSSEAMTTYTTPMVTTQMVTTRMVTSEVYTSESPTDPVFTEPFEDTDTADATTGDISLPVDPTEGTVTQQSVSATNGRNKELCSLHTRCTLGVQGGFSSVHERCFTIDKRYNH